MGENWIMRKGKDTIQDLSLRFAMDVVDLYKLLTRDKKEYVMSKQLLRSGTSIGANVRESQNAESGTDFIHKLSISLKEAGETEYWLYLLNHGGYISKKDYTKLNSQILSIIRMLTSIIKKKKQNMDVD